MASPRILKLRIMFIINSYQTAVLFTIITMLCWGSWANTQKIAGKKWRFELFYWDYVWGILLFSIFIGLTMGSMGSEGRSFIDDIKQSNFSSFINPIIGGVIFNLANILIVAAIAIAGMSLAFPVGVGLAMVMGVIINYLADQKGNPYLLFGGLALAAIGIIFDAMAYRKKSRSKEKAPVKGIILSIVGGALMAMFFRFVDSAVADNLIQPEAGKITPYTAFFFFTIGVFISNFIFNTYIMAKPIEGEKVSILSYFKGGFKMHIAGIIGGIIWSVGTMFSLLAADIAGSAISFGLGQGAIMIGAFWGVFIWKEFDNAPKASKIMLSLMFTFFIIGIILIVLAGM